MEKQICHNKITFLCVVIFSSILGPSVHLMCVIHYTHFNVVETVILNNYTFFMVKHMQYKTYNFSHF